MSKLYSLTSSLRRSRAVAGGLYHHEYTQIVVAVLIMTNFIVSAAEAQVGVNGKHKTTFDDIEFVYFVFFWIELIVNVSSAPYAPDEGQLLTPERASSLAHDDDHSCAFGAYLRWVSDPWNVFDVIVVVASTVDRFNPGQFIAVLRMMRAFRVFRFFKRVKSLQQIVTSIFKAVPGVMESLTILLIMMCMFALICYEAFHRWPCPHGPGSCNNIVYNHSIATDFTYGFRECSKKDSPGYGISGTTCRTRVNFGHEYFGNFLKSMYTLFQVCKTLLL